MVIICIVVLIISFEVVGLIVYMWRNTERQARPEMSRVLELLGKVIDSQPVLAESVGKGIAAGITGWVGGSRESLPGAEVDHSRVGTSNMGGIEEADFNLFELEDPWMEVGSGS